ncbi:hypothetical protein D3C78_1714910 [compost metagenome]
MLVNLSVWQSVEALREYVYRSAHADMLKRRNEWFTRDGQAHMVFWWVPRGHRPDVREAAARLAMLREQGPTPAAFTFRQSFLAPDQSVPFAPFDRESQVG